jgi:hypothetical protein
MGGGEAATQISFVSKGHLVCFTRGGHGLTYVSALDAVSHSGGVICKLCDNGWKTHSFAVPGLTTFPSSRASNLGVQKIRPLCDAHHRL